MDKNNKQHYWEVKDFLYKKPLSEDVSKPNLKNSISEILSKSSSNTFFELNEINKKIINSSNDLQNRSLSLLNHFSKSVEKQTPISKGNAKNIVSNLFNINEASLTARTNARQRAMDKFSLSLQQQNLNLNSLDQKSLTSLNIDPFAARKSQTVLPGIGTSTSNAPSTSMISSPTSSSLASTSSNVSTPSISPPPPSSMSGKSPNITPNVTPNFPNTGGTGVSLSVPSQEELQSMFGKSDDYINKNVGKTSATRLSTRRSGNILYGHSRVPNRVPKI
jgi:hypothetical protein